MNIELGFMVSTMAAYLALLFIVISIIFLPLKFIQRDLENSRYKLLYKIHVAAPKLSLILAFVHGFTRETVNLANIPTGWALGISLLILAILGALIGIKNDSEPLNESGDVEWRVVRIIKWLLTVALLLVTFLHFVSFFGV